MPAQLPTHEEINHSLAVQMQGFYRTIQADTSATFRKNILDALTSFTENYVEEFGFFDQAKLDALIFTNLIELNKSAAGITAHFANANGNGIQAESVSLKGDLDQQDDSHLKKFSQANPGVVDGIKDAINAIKIPGQSDLPLDEAINHYKEVLEDSAKALHGQANNFFTKNPTALKDHFAQITKWLGLFKTDLEAQVAAFTGEEKEAEKTLIASNKASLTANSQTATEATTVDPRTKSAALITAENEVNRLNKEIDSNAKELAFRIKLMETIQRYTNTLNTTGSLANDLEQEMKSLNDTFDDDPIAAFENMKTTMNTQSAKYAAQKAGLEVIEGVINDAKKTFEEKEFTGNDVTNSISVISEKLAAVKKSIDTIVTSSKANEKALDAIIVQVTFVKGIFEGIYTDFSNSTFSKVESKKDQFISDTFGNVELSTALVNADEALAAAKKELATLKREDPPATANKIKKAEEAVKKAEQVKTKIIGAIANSTNPELLIAEIPRLEAQLDDDKEALKIAVRTLKLEEFKAKYQNQL